MREEEGGSEEEDEDVCDDTELALGVGDGLEEETELE